MTRIRIGLAVACALASVFAVPPRAGAFTGSVTRNICASAGETGSAWLAAPGYCGYETVGASAIPATIYVPLPIERTSGDVADLAGRVHVVGSGDTAKGKVCARFYSYTEGTLFGFVTRSSNTICTTGSTMTAQNLNPVITDLPKNSMAIAQITVLKNTDDGNIARVNVVSWTFASSSLIP